MKKQIEEVQQYFKEKLLAGEFEIKTIDKYTAKVYIDGFSFELWLLGGKSYPYHGVGEYFIVLPEFSDEEQDKLGLIMDPIVSEYRATRYREAKLKQLEELKKELGEI